MTTNVPSVTFSDRGFVVPTDAAILTGMIADINAAFGGGLNPALSTPQGQLASSMSAIVAAADQTFAYITQQMDPAYNSGRFQDGIARIYFLTRKPAQPTAVACDCVGAAGVEIPAGSLAQDTSGNIYTCTDGGTIPVGGTISLQFANNEVGPIPCPAGTLNKIYLAIPGWDTITNPDDGVLGSDTESRADFEARRAASAAINSVNTLNSVLGKVFAVDGVLDAYVTENDTDGSETVGGVSLIANSLYVAVVGGSDADVAQAIWSKKPPGCAYNGNTYVTVYDENPLYAPPYPAYQVIFERPESLSIVIAVTLSNNPPIPSNAATLIQNAIIDAFAGVDGGTRARIGGNLLASRFYSPIAALGPWAQIESIFIGSANTSTAEFTGAIATTTLTVSAVASGLLAVGQTISDDDDNVTEGTKIVAQLTGVNAASVTASVSATTMNVTVVGAGVLAAGQVLHGVNITAGTTIVSQLTGSAGSTGTYRVSVSQTALSATVLADTPGTTGTYQVSLSQAVTSEDMITITPNLFNIQARIDQIPTIAAINIAVGLTS